MIATGQSAAATAAAPVECEDCDEDDLENLDIALTAMDEDFVGRITAAERNAKIAAKECLLDIFELVKFGGLFCLQKVYAELCDAKREAASSLRDAIIGIKPLADKCNIPLTIPSVGKCGFSPSSGAGPLFAVASDDLSGINGQNPQHALSGDFAAFEALLENLPTSGTLSQEFVSELRAVLDGMDQKVGDAENYLDSITVASQTAAFNLNKSINRDGYNHLGYSVPFIAHIATADGGRSEVRGTTDAQGGYSIFVPAGGRVVDVIAFDAKTNALGIAGEDRVPGSKFRLQPFFFLSIQNDISPDSDGDGLIDRAEDVLGTAINNGDTDKDGVSDGVEVFRGGDPLGALGTPTKIVAATSLAGSAKGVVVGQASTTTATNLAFVATGSAGLAVVDVTNPLSPAILSQITLQGDAGVVADSTDVAFSTSSQIAVVASGPAGLKFINVSDPRAPIEIGSKPINATQVEIHGGIAYANDGAVIRAYSIETGDLFQTISVGSTAVTGLAIEGDHLYAMDAGKNLTAFALGGVTVVKQDSESTGTVGGGQITVGNGVAYIAAETAANNVTGGFATWDVSNPNDLKIISGVDANNLAGRAIALNGSGLAVNVGSPGNLGNHAHLIRVSDPTNTGVLLPPDFVLPADPQSVVIANGLAFIADDTAGLLIVNYISPDVAGVPPTATLSSTATDADPVAPGVQVQAGSLLPIKLTVADDAQVASVELLKDGLVIGTDTSFPFEFGAIPAGLTAGGQTKLQIRATDTGGNVGLSNTLTFDLTADTTAPALTGSNPDEGGTRSGGLQTVRLFFSEALTQADLTAEHFTLTGPGGATVPVKTVTFSQLGKQVSITFDPLAAGAYTLRLDAANLHDLSGNALGTTPLDRHFNVINATKTFINADGGDWNSPANWENGTLPTAGDIVALPLNPGKSVTISSGAIKVTGILTDDTLQVTGGSLTLTGTSDIAGILKVSNGADLIVDGLNASLTVQNPLLDGGDLFSRHGGDFHFPTLQFFNFGNITVENPNGDFDAPVLQDVSGSSFYVKGGGILSLPAVTSYTHSTPSQYVQTYFKAEGTGSVLDLRNLTSLTNGQFYDNHVNVQALNGGKIDLRKVTNITDPNSGDQRYRSIVVSADGVGSTIDLSALSSFSDSSAGSTTGENLYSQLMPANGGTITAPVLTSLTGVWTILSNASVLATSQWTSLNNSRLELKTAGYNLNALQQAPKAVLLVNAGAYSFPALQSAPGANITVNGSGSSASLTALLDLSLGSLTLSGGATAAANNLTNVDGASFYVSGGVTLSLPAVTSYTHSTPSQYVQTYFKAEGTGSVLDLRNLTSLTNGQFYDNHVNVQALNGGKIDLRKVTNITDPNSGDQRYRSIVVSADGVGSTIDLSALSSFSDSSAGSTTGENLYSQLMPANGGTITAPVLTSLTGVWTILSNASVLATSQWTSLNNSRLELKTAGYNLNALQQAPKAVLLVNAGAYSFPALQSAPGANITVNGSGSSASLTALLDLSLGSLTLSGGATAAANNLTNVDGASFYVSGGVTLSLPAVTSYTHSTPSQYVQTYFKAEGTGSVLDLRNLTSLTNGQFYDNHVNVQALNGGKIDLRKVTNITDPNSGDQRYRSIVVSADGVGSTIDLSALSSFSDSSAGSTTGENLYSQLMPANGGTITAPVLTSLTGVWTILSNASVLATSQWTSLNNSRLELKTAGYNLNALQQAPKAVLLVNAGAYSFPALQSAPGANITVNGSGSSASLTALLDLSLGSLTLSGGATAAANNLTNVDGASFYVSGGVTLSLPAVTSYTHSTPSQYVQTYFKAEGTGSVLDLRNLTSLTNGQFYDNHVNVQALNGGKIDLRKVLNITDTATGDQRYRNIDIRADGIGSEINLLALLTFVDNYAGSTTGENLSSAIREFNQGTILVPGTLVTQGVIVSV